MPQFLDAPVPPDALTTFVREVPKPRNNRISELFTQRTLDTNTVDFAEIVKTNRTAKYRSFDGRIHVSSRDTGSEKRVPLAPLSSSSPAIGEYERLQMEFARTQGTNKAALERAVYNDGENLTNEVYNRIELAWGDVLTDGKLTINENGYQDEADYGVPANHFVAPAAAPFSNITTSTPLTDFVNWCDTYNATNGFLPGSMLTTLQVLRYLQRNKEIIDAVFGATQGRTHVNRAELNNLFTSEGLPSVLDPYDNILDVDGVATRVLPNDRIILLPPNLEDLGFTAYGTTATALRMADSGEIDRAEVDPAGIVAKVTKVDGPPVREFTWVDACGQPILSNARRLMVVDAF
ncbi:major capsid protein [Rhodococcus sp. 14-2470-1a]|uniref:major capsid protein n=1 Tax=Rhodococcus sp. 14-2470-1a TaxID=2023150 RepID=UPI000B9A9C36|nr:major capsid protein [Rhodococcus sp. 14-2470-1a]OZF47564.1 hypothetical protein CH292_19260 [Rhodococcus sp. 14-2470-1a]